VKIFSLGLIAASIAVGGNEGPVALTWDNGTVFALSVDCRVSRVEGGKRQGEIQLAAVGVSQCLDLAVLAREGRPNFFVVVAKPFVSAVSQQSSKIEQLIDRYDSQGKQTGYWRIGSAGGASAVASNPSDGTLYVATLTGGEIYRLDVGSKQELQYILQIPKATRIRSLAVDRVEGSLFAGDAFDGHVYRINIATRHADLIAEGLGEPTAMAFDSKMRRLYVADEARRSVWYVDVASKAPVPVRFWTAKDLLEPLGLTLDGSLQVWVGDRAGKAIHTVSPSGRLVQTVK
jgi:hypothetical protein